MRDPSRAEPVRAILAALACTSLTGTLAPVAADLAVGALRAGTPLDRPVAAVVVGIGTAAAAVLTVGCWLLAAASLGRRSTGPVTWCDRVGAQLTPALLRRAVGLTMGAGLGVAALGGVASASEPDLGWEVTTATEIGTSGAQPEVAQSSPDPSEEGTQEQETVPDDPVTPAPEELADGQLPTPALAPPGVPETDVGTVTVRRGDSLWRIATEHLGGGSDAEIAAAWPRWYEANRAVIGADPDLIHPGQVLRVPSDVTIRPVP